jgi:hypothetical protein
MIPPRTRGGNVPQARFNYQNRAARAARAARMEKIYETPRVGPMRAPGASSVLIKSTVRALYTYSVPLLNLVEVWPVRYSFSRTWAVTGLSEIPVAVKKHDRVRILWWSGDGQDSDRHRILSY